MAHNMGAKSLSPSYALYAIEYVGSYVSNLMKLKLNLNLETSLTFANWTLLYMPQACKTD